MQNNSPKQTMKDMPEDYWREKLTPEQYAVLREKNTERAFTGKLYDNKEPGVYKCGACGKPLFKSDTKYDSGTGWPSFWDAVDPEAVKLEFDDSHGMRRVEVTCSNCGSHLGHMFEDGPQDKTGMRYCINSCALNFEKM